MRQNSKRPDISRNNAFAELLLFAIVICILYLNYIPNLFVSLALDEAASYWLIKDGLYQLISRSITIPNKFSVYNFIALLVSYFTDSTEVSLRMPSVIFTLAAAYFIFLITDELFPGHAKYLSAVVFLLLDLTIHISTSARPYSLCLLLLTTSSFFLIKWVKLRNYIWLAVYSLTIITMLYCHLIYIFAIPCHFIYVLSNHRNIHLTAKRSKLFIYLIVISILLLPYYYLIYRNINNSGLLTFAPVPSITYLIVPYTPTVLLVSFLIFIISSNMNSKSISLNTNKNFICNLIFILSWVILPPLLLYIASLLSGCSLLVDRYYSSYLPAVAILTAVFFVHVRDNYIRYISFSAMVIVLLISNNNKFFNGLELSENWREATQYILKIDPEGKSMVLLASGLVEARDSHFLYDPLLSSYVAAPLSYYKLPNNFMNLPWTFDSYENQSYYYNNIKPQLKNYRDIFVLFRRWDTFTNKGRDKLSLPCVFTDFNHAGFKFINNTMFGSVAIKHFRNYNSF